MNEYQEGSGKRPSGRRSRGKEPAVNWLFVAIVILYILVTILFAVLAARGASLHLPLVIRLISGELVLLIPTLIYMAFARPGFKSLSERWRLPVAVIPLLILMAYCILPLISLVNLISMWLSGENAAASLFAPMQQLPLWVSVLCIAVLPGFLEELIFRGLFYSAYRKRRTWGAIFASALLFGLMHMNLNQLCYAFVMGIMFCLIYEGTGSLLSTMLIHAVYNGNSVLMMYFVDSSAYLEDMGNAALTEQMFGGAMGAQMLITGIVLAIAALLGLAAAGGLYVAIVRLCGRGPYVKLLFQRNSYEKRRALTAGYPTEKMAKTEDMYTDNREGETISRKLWGPVLWLGVLLAAAVILWNFLAL